MFLDARGFQKCYNILKQKVMRISLFDFRALNEKGVELTHVQKYVK